MNPMKKKILNNTLVFLTLLLAVACSPTPNTLYVKTNANGAADGSSWDNAFGDIQAAIDLAQDGDSIWIAAGTYLPQSDSGYIITKGINILGGFKGDEQFSKERVFQDTLEGIKLPVYETIITGDRKQDDDLSKWDKLLVEDASSKTQPWTSCKMNDNCSHLFFNDTVMKSMLRIDGLKIIGGVADNGGRHNNGGAIYSKSDLEVKNCDIRSCYALKDGGGIYLPDDSESHVVIASNFIHECWSEDGAGISTSQNVIDIQITNNCVFSCYAQSAGGAIKLESKIGDRGKANYDLKGNNIYKCSAYSSATPSAGGGLYVNIDNNIRGDLAGGKLILENNTLKACNATNIKQRNVYNQGGGMCIIAPSINKELEFDCKITHNKIMNCYINSFSGVGGGAYIEGEINFSDNFITECFVDVLDEKYRKYMSESKGGGVYCDRADINRCLISDCVAYDGGGAIIQRTSKIENSKIVNCKSYRMGGCLILFGYADLNNCLIANGYSEGVGGGIYCQNATKVNINKATIVSNISQKEGGGVFLQNRAVLTNSIAHTNLSYSCTQGDLNYSGSKEFFDQVEFGIDSYYVLVSGSAITGYSSGGRDNITLSEKNHSDQNSSEMHPQFKQPSYFIGFVSPWKLKKEEDKQYYYNIHHADWSLEEASPCGDLGCGKEVTRLNQNMWDS